jgi:hypothetical protein
MTSIKNKLFTIALVSILALGIIGLSSWKAPQPKKGATDTTRKSKKQEAHYSKKTIITFDKDGNPHEEVVENFEGDEGLKELMMEDMHFDFDFPPIPEMDIMLPDLPHVFMPPMYFDMDTTAFKRFRLDSDPKVFDEELEARLREQFESAGPEMEASMEDMARRLQEMSFRFDNQFNQNLEDQMLKMEEHLKDLDGSIEERLRDLNFNLDKLGKLDYLHEFSNSYPEKLKEFEKVAQEELVKDGYLKQDEKIESISWSDDVIEFNGKMIKREHVDKYRDLKEKYLKYKSNRGRIE